jgi:2-dehydro-3-deoxyphosphogluconate aldolase / (4S)-4-hydroxy-2-oxoglutarate aldolase
VPPVPPVPTPPLPRQLTDTRIVAVLRTATADSCLLAARTLIAAGVTCVEITFTTPDATQLIRTLRDEVGSGAVIGAGTILTAADAEKALAAGAQFLVSPAPCADVIATAVTAGVPAIPGAFTPHEVLLAWNSGAAAVKVFPAVTGGPAHVQALRGPLPHIPLIPTGGVSPASAPDYLAAGATAVGLGSELVGRVADIDVDLLTKRSHEALRACAHGRESRP